MRRAFGRVPLRATTIELTYHWLHRVVALYCLLFGLMYWTRLIGVYEGQFWRFDLMPVHWQVAAVVLAVLFPFAASGLWMLASWGPVIWFVCAAAEAVMYVGLPHLFGHRELVVVSHVMVAILYAVLRFMLHRQRRQAED